MTRARILADYVSSGDELALKAPLASPAFTGTPSITLGSDATNDVYYRAASGALTRLGIGADGTVLTSTGASTAPAFEAIPASDPTTGIADGEFLTANANVADNDFLRIDGTAVEGLSASEVATAISSTTTGKALAFALIF